MADATPNGVRSVGWFIEKVGLPSAVTIVVILAVLGLIPSVLTSQHEEISERQQYIIAIGLANFNTSYAQCINEAERSRAALNVEEINIQKRRCDAAKRIMETFLDSFSMHRQINKAP